MRIFGPRATETSTLSALLGTFSTLMTFTSTLNFIGALPILDIFRIILNTVREFLHSALCCTAHAQRHVHGPPPLPLPLSLSPCDASFHQRLPSDLFDFFLLLLTAPSEFELLWVGVATRDATIDRDRK